jgi:hypothetical protein
MVGYTGDRNAQPHGGEKSAALKIDNEWDAPIAASTWDAPIVTSTEDWGTTAVSTTEEEWNELEKTTAKLSIKKKKDIPVSFHF